MRQRRIVGVQVHHHVKLRDAASYLANGCTALTSAIVMTGDPDLQVLHDELAALCRRVGVHSHTSYLRFLDFRSDPDFKRMVEGELPYPDETLAAFVPRCTCNDRCLVHDHGVEHAPEGQCNCGKVCPAHPEGDS
jgi:hypothetical protein